MKPELNKMIKEDIERCKSAQSTKSGSPKLYQELIAKYEDIYPGFKTSIPVYVKMGTLGEDFDYRDELNVIKSKLETKLRLDPIDVSEDVLNKIKRELEQCREIISNPEKQNENTIKGFYRPFSKRYNDYIENKSDSIIGYNETENTYDVELSCDEFLDNLSLMQNDLELFCDEHTKFGQKTYEEECDLTKNEISKPNINNSKDVFVVHGHDEEIKQEVARFIQKFDLNPIILHEQISEGRTIIEKIEAYSNVEYAIVLYSPCDIGYKYGEENNKKGRARQNVVFEHGYLIGKLGRKNVCALKKGEVETPNDISGVVYIDYDTAGGWKLIVAKEMKKIWPHLDLNKLY
ncbi:nucleotide-binding protein [Acetobacterium sp. MES1]|uniref:nucleotide-binding protein n=1 Tax=Acetobacterium sp. MES1 TaxID=1899015 RepID=UPI00257DB36E|nr:nucleotide-binding protein [Acetobacterium sp. MES1]